MSASTSIASRASTPPAFRCAPPSAPACLELPSLRIFVNDNAARLASLLIRNFRDAPMESFMREPLYAGVSARLGTGTAAAKLGASIDVVPPGKRSCPYHFHHAQEEMFI